MPADSATRSRSAAQQASDAALVRAGITAVIMGIALGMLTVALAALISDRTAINGALLGTGLTLVLTVPTMLVMIASPRLSMNAMAASVLGSWAVKMLIVVAVLFAIRNVAAIDLLWVGIAVVIGAFAALIAETVLLAKNRRPLDVPEGSEPSRLQD